MFILFLLELTVTILLVVSIVTQVIVPIMRNGKLFPAFRSERKALTAKLADVRYREENLRIEQEIEESERNLTVDKKK